MVPTPGKRVFALAASRGDFEPMRARLEQTTGARFLLIRPPDLTPEVLVARAVTKVFLPHWSHIIPPAVYETVECVIFHMTDVPFGRGGSPLQNLIVRGFKDTRISALRCVRELDAGPVYLKSPLSLDGTAEEILTRAYGIIEGMITRLVQEAIVPVPQEGPVTVFHRRRPQDGSLDDCLSIGEAYDRIRMLDGAGYPRAFLETPHLRLEFSEASVGPDSVTAVVRISRRSLSPEDPRE